MKNNLRNIPLNSSTAKEYEIQKKWCFDKGFGSRQWQRYLQVLNQLIGLISVKGNEDFENRQNLLFQCCYANGGVVLSFIGGRLQIWTISGEIKFDINGDLEYVDCLPFIGIGNQGYVNMTPKRFKGSQVVYIQGGPYGMSLWVLWSRIIQDNVQLMDIYLTNAKINVKKLLLVVNNDSANITQEEIDELMDPTSPIIKSINPITKSKGSVRDASGEQNIWEPLNLGSQDYSFEDVQNHWIFETNLMGLYSDEYHKKERNTTGENEMTQANTVLLHEVYLREFKRAEKEINKKFGINITFYKTFELSVEDGEEEQEDEVQWDNKK